MDKLVLFVSLVLLVIYISLWAEGFSVSRHDRTTRSGEYKGKGGHLWGEARKSEWGLHFFSIQVGRFELFPILRGILRGLKRTF